MHCMYCMATKPISLRIAEDVKRALEQIARRFGTSPATLGAYINADDPVLLEACWQDGRALVSKDRATLPGWIALRIAEGKEHSGVLFYDLERFKSHQVGALAKAIAMALEQTRGRLANRWIT